jgi:hypothetical protein
MKKLLLLTIGLVFLVTPVWAFHDGGVAHCNGCHTMHNSQDGAPVDPDSPNGNPWLLNDASPSDVCIGCHDHLDQTLGHDPLVPPTERGAGNFVYLLEDNLNDGHGGAANPISGDAAGHNLWAPGHSLAPDATLTTAPGGTFPASVLGCTSCHDPHGSTDFRFLYGSGRVVQDGVATFTADAPTAIGASIFGPGESDTYHTAYQGGMSAWCGNCHGDFHDNNTQLVHPSGQAMGATIATTYSLYNGTSDLQGATPSESYLAAVPFEDPANAIGFTGAPSATSQVSCITCHRAHATSAPDAGRWDFSVTLLDEDGTTSLSYAIPNPYGDPNQRSLCNKCHVKDEFDHITP